MWAPDRHILDSQGGPASLDDRRSAAPWRYWYVFATCPTPSIWLRSEARKGVRNAPNVVQGPSSGLPERAVGRATLCAKATNCDNPLNKSCPLSPNGQDLSNRFSGTVRCGLRIATSSIPRPRWAKEPGWRGVHPEQTPCYPTMVRIGTYSRLAQRPPQTLRAPTLQLLACQSARSTAQLCARKPQISTTH